MRESVCVNLKRRTGTSGDSWTCPAKFSTSLVINSTYKSVCYVCVVNNFKALSAGLFASIFVCSSMGAMGGCPVGSPNSTAIAKSGFR